MNTVNMKKAREHLSKLVGAAERGESVIITRRGKQVARIVPARRGPLRKLPDLAEFRASIKVKGKPLSKTVIAMRAQERY
jgi:prevent-host-death family protein